MNPFPTLNGFGPTRKTLQRYARALSAVARAHGVAHPHWWHISLRVTPDGLQGDNVPLPGGGVLAGRLDLLRHELLLLASDGRRWSAPLTEGLSGTAMGERVLAAAADAGLRGAVERDRFESDDPGVYDREAAGRFFTALVGASLILKRHRARLEGKTSPVQFWPHGFDLAMELYGTKMVRHEENGQTKELPAQLNLGFYPGEDDDSSYFYSNPWPFDARQLLDRPLPEGAGWHTEGWQGTMLPYAAVRDDPRAAERVLAYAGAVYDIACPYLRAQGSRGAGEQG
ncbi:DUF5996 family protein [Promineifilum sp.]|uniref:DUF5996 family protein n=1 Tax=Promineifilum sp. TaxID=2664178 RepID=UPI0035B0619E